MDGKEIGAIEYAYSLMAKEADLIMSRTALLEGKRGRLSLTLQDKLFITIADIRTSFKHEGKK